MTDEPSPSPPPESSTPIGGGPSTLSQHAAELKPGPGSAIPAMPGFPFSTQQQFALQVWQGQFPPPEAIERYERVMPGAFDRLFRMSERQMDASIAAGAQAQMLIQADTRRGHWLGFSVAISAMGGGITCAMINQPVVACAFLSVPLLSVAKTLIDSARERADNREQVATTPGAPAANADDPDASQ